MFKLFTTGNLKTYLIVIGIGVAIWFYKDYKYQKSENKRQSENIHWIRMQDSLRFSAQTYNKKEIEDYLETNRRDLSNFIDNQNIKIRRIENIITQSLSYNDTVSNNINLQPILDAIEQNQSLKVPVIDSTECLVVSGFVTFENDTLSLNITDRKFSNKTDIISYWERNQWKFLGIKTRLFGRKKATVTIEDNCGRSETFIINKKK